MTHTPGPWETYGDMVFSPNNGVICQLSVIHRDDKFVIHSKLNIGSNDWNEAMNNAALIAAAPDLLAACKDAKAAIESLPDDALGYAHDGRSQWPIKAELLSKLTNAIKNSVPKGAHEATPPPVGESLT